MTPELIEVIVKITKTTDFDIAWDILKKGAALLELRVPYYVCSYLPFKQTLISETEACNHLVYKDEYPDSFNEIYNQRGYVDYDLGIAWALKENRSAIFSEIFQPVITGELGGKYKEFYDMFRETICNCGAMIPLTSSPGLGLGAMTILTQYGLSDEEGQKLLLERLEDMEILAYAFHNSRSLKKQSLKQFKLTKLEQEVLRCICMGKRTKQIAHEQGKFVGVVEKQIANIKKKLGATTLQQAVAKAIHFELVEF